MTVVMPGKCSFQIRWLKDADYMDWLLPVPTDKHSARCIFCGIDLRLQSMGESVLRQHKGSARHTKSAVRFKSNTRCQITDFVIPAGHKSAATSCETQFCDKSDLHTEEASKKVIPLIPAASNATFPSQRTGPARLILSFQNSLETWEKRLTSNALKSIVLQESDWANIYHVLEEWALLLDKAVEQIEVSLQSPDSEEASQNASCDIRDVIRRTQKWAMRVSNSINSEDAKLVEQVSSLHSEIIRWMVQVLLRLAPDRKDNSQEAAEMALMGSASIPQLTETANLLVKSLEMFSNYVALCCDGIVVENTLARQGNHEENADSELKDLKRLKTECTEWTKVAQMLLSQLTGNAMEQLFADTVFATSLEKSADLQHNDVTYVGGDNVQHPTLEGVAHEELRLQERAETHDSTATSEAEIMEHMKSDTTNQDDMNSSAPTDSQLTTPTPRISKTEDGQRIEVLGYDANTHTQTIEGKHIQFLSQQHARSRTEGSLDTGKAYEALAAIDTLQHQLIATEERAQLAEERASQAEAHIVALQERIRALEKQVGKQQEKVDPQSSPALATQYSKSPSNVPSRSPKVHSPVSGADTKEEKSGRKSGRSSSSSSKRN